MNKKADGGLTAIVIIVVILIFIGWLVNLSNRDCSKDNDCKDGQYCGSDFSCHDFKIVEKDTIVQQFSLTGPAIIIGIAIVIAAIILKGKVKFWQKEEQKHVSDYSESKK